MAVKRLLQLRPQYDDGNGALASNYRLFFYAAGSSTKQNTYNSSTGSVANANPIVLNARGEPPVEIWGTVGQTYKIGLAIAGTDDPPASFIWTEDNVAPVNDTTVTLDQWQTGPTPTYVSATSFTLTGDQTSNFHKARRVKTTNTSGTVYSTIINSVFGALTTVTVANDSGSLDSGLSAVSYSLLAADNPSVDADMVRRKGGSVASAATTDIWSIAGDFVHVTGTTGITSLGTAPYAGLERTVIFDGALTLTHNATTLVLPGGANITTAANDRMVVRADTTANMIVVAYIKATGRPVNTTAATQPTRQTLKSGTGATYTTPAGATRINVRMVGAGGGGGAVITNAGSNGTNTTFGTLTAAFGSGGAPTAGAGGAGGAAGITGDVDLAGGAGSPGPGNVNSPVGGAGGVSAFGGAGTGGNTNAAGNNAAANTGAGGGGAGGDGATVTAGAGGGAGAYVEKLITAPAANYTYTVGAGGAGGVAGTRAGGNGAAGIIIVDEFYD